MSNPASTHGAGPVLRCLSLGAGVQSTAVLLLACEGVIPPFGVALFADPDGCSPWSYRSGIPVAPVTTERAA